MGTRIAWAVLVALVAHPALADPKRTPIALEWEAPASCPDRSQAIHKIEQLLRGPAEADEPVAARVEIKSIENARWSVRLLVTQASGGTGERYFEGASCERVADAVALILALTIDPVAVAAASSEPPAPIEPKAKPAPRVVTPPSRPRPRPRPRPDESERTEVHGIAGLRAAGDVGTLPAPTMGVGAVFDLVIGRARLEADGTAWLPRTADADREGSGAEVGLLSAALHGCVALLWTSVVVDACFGGEGGRSSGNGVGIAHPRQAVGPWWALLGGVAVRAPGNGPITTWFLLEAGVPLVRSEVVIDEVGVVHEPAPVIGRAALSLGFSLF